MEGGVRNANERKTKGVLVYKQLAVCIPLEPSSWINLTRMDGFGRINLAMQKLHNWASKLWNFVI